MASAHELPGHDIKSFNKGFTSSPSPMMKSFASLLTFCVLAVSAAPSVVDTTIYDYVIVGGGTTGLAVAVRLAEDPNINVAVLEAGETGLNDPKVTDMRLRTLWVGTKYDWQIYSIPQSNLNGRVFRQAQGKLLGGTSAVHGGTWVKPVKAEYDGMQDIGAVGWSYPAFSKAFKKAEHFYEPDRANLIDGLFPDISAHGVAGPINVSIQNVFGPFYKDVVIPTLKNLNRPITGEYNGGDKIGAHPTQLTISPKTYDRSYVVNGYLSAGKPNLHVLTEAPVSKILWDDSQKTPKARAVEYVKAGVVQTINTKNVIVSAGAFNTPKVLEHSGIGDPKVLAFAGVPLKIANVNVGNNFQHHPGVDVFYRLKANATVMGEETEKAIIEFAPMATLLSKEDLLVSDQLLATKEGTISEAQWTAQKKMIKQGVAQSEVNWGLRNNTDGSLDFQITFTTLHSYNRGYVHINSSDVNAPLNYNPNAMTTSWDLWYLSKSVEAATRIVQVEPLKSLIQAPISLANGTDFESIKAHVRSNSRTLAHFSGSAAALKGEYGVVDPVTFKVYGTRNVFVADCSTIAMLPGVHTGSIAYAIAEHAAVQIKAQR